MQSALEWPKPVSDLCQQIEAQGIATWSQGEGLLNALRPHAGPPTTTRDRFPTQSLLCATDAATLLRALPNAVVSASHARRLTQATAWGPVDLIPMGPHTIETQLPEFGLAPFAFAFRIATQEWCDPLDLRRGFERGTLAPATVDRNPFRLAPRRYWIVARLLAEHALQPTSELLAMAREAFPETLDRLPQGAPARREITRILESPAPGNGLAWLRESGVSGALFPGMQRAGEAQVAQLAPLPELRWAVWLHGCPIQRALVRLRMPLALAKKIERIHASHPIERAVESMREAGVRRILQRLGAEEIDGLFAWRRLELDSLEANAETRSCTARLAAIEARMAEVRSQRARTGLVRRLALDGQGVMEALGSGPGPHVGRALAHLARFVEQHPEANDRARLERELCDWAVKQDDGRA